jgi:hypothetical protein
MTIRVMPSKEFAALLLVTGLRKGTWPEPSYCKRPSAATEGGSQLTRFDQDMENDGA